MLSRLFLLKNGKCCGNGCFMCPYEPKHSKKSKLIRDEIYSICNSEELSAIKSLSD
tara:strand:+ start:70 stop:237 length:168 start_codon:yes stop_codon:yes gene_type:complete